jgi:hypothetical protein
MQALSRDPEARPRSAGELISRLQAALQPQPPAIRMAGRVPASEPRRTRAAVAAAGAIALGALAVAAIVIANSGRPRQHAATADATHIASARGKSVSHRTARPSPRHRRTHSTVATVASAPVVSSPPASSPRVSSPPVSSPQVSSRPVSSPPASDSPAGSLAPSPIDAVESFLPLGGRPSVLRGMVTHGSVIPPAARRL